MSPGALMANAPPGSTRSTRLASDALAAAPLRPDHLVDVVAGDLRLESALTHLGHLDGRRGRRRRAVDLDTVRALGASGPVQADQAVGERLQRRELRPGQHPVQRVGLEIPGTNIRPL